MSFINIHGQPWAPSAASTMAKRKAERPVQEKSHKGFRVVGHPPGALESARDEHALQVARAKADPDLKQPKAWDEAFWRANAKKRPVRSKPYEVASSADLCAELARKAGWLDVEVVALIRE